MADRSPWFTVNFDSSSGLVNALSCSLHQKSFSGVGTIPESELLARLINWLPWRLKKLAYVKGSAKGAISPSRLGNVVAEEYSNWVVGRYPRQKYPAIMIGSSNGAAVHLGAAMQIPLLPQTFLIPVKTPRHLSVDEPIARMEWAKKYARQLLQSNPDIQLHHMMDPNQDRPMLESTSYFRLKRLTLGSVYEQFLTENLEENGTIIIVRCDKKWPVSEADNRYYFQFGGLGGTSIEEYFQGTEQVASFLKKAGSSVDHWTAPIPDKEMPEAEWGFLPDLEKDIYNLAERQGYRVRTVRFNEPEDLSPYVADLYRWWYRKQGLPSDRLLIGTFFLIEPYWTLHSRSVPFWMAFNAKDSVTSVMKYLQRSDPFDRIYLLPFSHGVDGQGLATVEDYEGIFRKARFGGDFIGSEPHLYPFDFGIYARYSKDLQKKLQAGVLYADNLTMDELDRFNHANRDYPNVQWTG